MKEEKIRFKYKFADDYNPKYINGAYGGVGTRGELFVNFYVERQPIPKEEVHSLSDEAIVGDLLERSLEDLRAQVIRFVEQGIILNLETAKRIHEWLGEQIMNIEHIMERSSDE